MERAGVSFESGTGHSVQKNKKRKAYPKAMDLIVCVFEPKDTWSHVKKLIERGEWKSIVIITDKAAQNEFTVQKTTKKIIIDGEQPAGEIIKHLIVSLKPYLFDFEAGLNMVSGSGKEHMCVLAAILKLGVGVRLMALTKEGVKEL